MASLLGCNERLLIGLRSKVNQYAKTSIDKTVHVYTVLT
jgi:hypothetical protein